MLAVVMPAAADEVYIEVDTFDNPDGENGLKQAIARANVDKDNHYKIVAKNRLTTTETLTITGDVTLTTVPGVSSIGIYYQSEGNMFEIAGGKLTIYQNSTNSDSWSSPTVLVLVGNDNKGSLVYVGKGENGEEGTFIFKSGKLRQNSAEYGGGVYVDDGGVFILDGGEIQTNLASKDGGGVYVNTGGSFVMKGGSIHDSKATGNGGGVYINDGSFEMNGGTIGGGNQAVNGAGVYVNDGTFTMGWGNINGNSASMNGGGVYVNKEGFLDMTGGNIWKNNQAVNGAGVYINDGYLNLVKGNIEGNTATVDGGGLYLANGAVVTMEGGTLQNNNAEYGGGVYIHDSSFEMRNAETTPTINNNNAKHGGGVYINGGDGLKLAGGVISGNTATQRKNEAGTGGAIYINKGSVHMRQGGETETGSTITITQNTADKGSAIYAAPGTTFTMEAGEITSNNAGLSGFAVCIDKATLNLINGKITDNKAGLYGGVYVDGKFTLGDLSEGWAIVTGNSGANAFLMEGTTITIPKRLHVNTNIGVTHQNQNPDEPTLIAQGIERGSYKPDFQDAGHFFSDQKDYSVEISNGKIYLVYDPEEPKGSSTWIQAPGGSYGLYTGTVNNGGTVNLPDSSPVEKITLPAGFSGEVQVSTEKDPNLPAPTTGTVYKQFDVSTTATLPYGTTATIGITFSVSDLPQGQGILVLHYQGADRGWVVEPSTATLTGDRVTVTATVSGFSPFAIVFDESGVIPTEAVNGDIAPPLENPGVVATPAESPAPVVGVLMGLLAGLTVLGVRRG